MLRSGAPRRRRFLNEYYISFPRHPLAFYDGEDDGAGGGGGGGGGKTPEQQLVALNAQNKALLNEKKTMAERLKSYEGIDDPQAARDALAARDAAEADRQKKAGEYDAMTQKMKDAHKKELEKSANETAMARRALHRTVARQELGKALIGADGKPVGNATLLEPHLLPFIKVDPNPNATSEDDLFIFSVVDKTGQPRIKDGNGTPFAVADLLGEYQKDTNFSDAFYAPDTAGSGRVPNPSNQRTERQASASEVYITSADASVSSLYRARKAEAEKAGKTLVIRDPSR